MSRGRGQSHVEAAAGVDKTLAHSPPARLPVLAARTARPATALSLSVIARAPANSLHTYCLPTFFFFVLLRFVFVVSFLFALGLCLSCSSSPTCRTPVGANSPPLPVVCCCCSRTPPLSRFIILLADLLLLHPIGVCLHCSRLFCLS